MSNPDNYIEGTFDTDHPANQHDSEPQPDEIWECLDAENYERAYELLSEIRKETKLLRDLFNQTNIDGKNDFVIKKLTKIYNKI